MMGKRHLGSWLGLVLGASLAGACVQGGPDAVPDTTVDSVSDSVSDSGADAGADMATDMATGDTSPDAVAADTTAPDTANPGGLPFHSNCIGVEPYTDLPTIQHLAWAPPAAPGAVVVGDWGQLDVVNVDQGWDFSVSRPNWVQDAMGPVIGLDAAAGEHGVALDYLAATKPSGSFGLLIRARVNLVRPPSDNVARLGITVFGAAETGDSPALRVEVDTYGILKFTLSDIPGLAETTANVGTLVPNQWHEVSLTITAAGTFACLDGAMETSKGALPAPQEVVLHAFSDWDQPVAGAVGGYLKVGYFTVDELLPPPF